MSEHSQVVSWTIDLQGEPYDLSFWALKFSRAEGLRYWVEREEITLPRYYLHSSKFDGLRDTEIQTAGGEAVRWMNGVMAVWDQPRPVMMGLSIGICADGSRIPMTRVEASSQTPLVS